MLAVSGAGGRQGTLRSDSKSLPASAQVKKVKKLKREWKRQSNPFHQLQAKRSFWSATHPAKAASLSSRL